MIRIFDTNYSVSQLVSTVGMVISVIILAFLLSVSGIAALVFAGCAYISREFDESGPMKERIKAVLSHLSPIITIIIVSAIVQNCIDDESVKNIAEIICRIAAIVFIFPLLMQRSYYDRTDATTNLPKDFKLTSNQLLKYELTKTSYRILILAGCILSIIYGGFFPAILAVIGGILWIVYIFIACYYFVHCDFKADCAEQSEVEQKSSDNYNDKEISESEVNRIVRKIADRWSYKEEISYMLSGGGRIRYNVSVEVIGGNIINYTISGKMSGVREEQRSEAYTFFGSKMDKAAYKIIEETKNELAKHKLPYSSYDVNVNKGYIE